jgi:hypothetical protein
MKNYANGVFSHLIVTQRLIPDVINHLKKSYYVREKAYVKLKQRKCFEINDISNLQGKDLYTHLVLVFTFHNDKSDGSLAWADTCAFHPISGRPIAGQVNLNLYKMTTFTEEKYTTNFETVLHEVHHVLGINIDVFPLFTNKKTHRRLGKRRVLKKVWGDSGKKNDYYYNLIVPGLVKYTRQYFNCQDIQGLRLEDQGGEDSKGSHFEKLWFGNELMIANDHHSIRVSSFTFKVLEESGWYIPNYGMSEDLEWLRNDGCKIIDNSCANHKRTCDPSSKKRLCSEDFTLVGYCEKNDDFTDGCPVFSSYDVDCRRQAHQNKDHVVGSFGPGSRCFQGNIDTEVFGSRSKVQDVFCAVSECHEDSYGKFITLLIRGVEVECHKSGEVVYYDSSNKNLFAICPDIKSFCGYMDRKCPNDCSLKGRCRSDGTCFCYRGYMGKDCSIVNNKIYEYDFRMPLTPEVCEPECQNGGVCFHGKCECAMDYSGEDCTEHNIFAKRKNFGFLKNFGLVLLTTLLVALFRA